MGNYDGVHLGHQQMIAVLKRRAAELKSAATVLVFEPSSKEFIDPDGAPPRLTRWREKFVALAALGRRSSGDAAIRRAHACDEPDAIRRRIDRRRTRVRSTWWSAMIFATAAMPAAHIETLTDGRPVARLRRRTDAAIHGRRRAGEQHRGARAAGAGRLSGCGAPSWAPLPDDRAASLTARRLGRTLGFPTANLRLDAAQVADVGNICGARATASRRAPMPGVASLGTRPTRRTAASRCSRCMCSIFPAICTDALIEVEFVAKLRDEVKFDSLDALMVQMQSGRRACARPVVVR